MKACLLFFFSFLLSAHLYTQKGIEKLTRAKIDSLRNERVDTILWFRSYCGECEIRQRKADDIINYYNCTMQSGYGLLYNAIIYKQEGKYFMMNLDCHNSSIKRQLNNCQSIPYFISIIQALNKRDRLIKEMHKKGKFPGPIQVDGDFDEADIYFNKVTQHISMSDLEENDKTFKKYFWIPKQLEFLRLLSEDITVKG